MCALGLAVAALVVARSARRGAKAAAGCTVLAAVVMVMPARGEDAPLNVGAIALEKDTVVTHVSTTVTDGVFRSEVVVMTDGTAVSRHTMWGGSVGGIRQIVGGSPVPVPGDRVQIVVASRVSAAGALRLANQRAR